MMMVVVVTYLTTVCDIRGPNPSVDSCMFIAKATAIYTAIYGCTTLLQCLCGLSLLPSLGLKQIKSAL